MASSSQPKEEVQTLLYIQSKQSQINEFFKSMKLKSNQFQKTQEQTSQSNTFNTSNAKNPQQKKNEFPKYYTNYRKQKIYPVEQLKKNYQNAFFGTKWLQLPYCRRSIFGKIQFWFGASFIFTYMWGSYYMRKNNLTNLSWKYHAKTYGFFALASVVYVFAESIFFQPYCDINSYHYQTTNNLNIARDIKRQLRQISK